MRPLQQLEVEAPRLVAGWGVSNTSGIRAPDRGAQPLAPSSIEATLQTDDDQIHDKTSDKRHGGVRLKQRPEVKAPRLVAGQWMLNTSGIKAPDRGVLPPVNNSERAALQVDQGADPG